MATSKYYRVKQDNFLWLKDAILFKLSGSDGYAPIEDIWDVTDANGSEYISTRIIEAPENAQYFERVYPDTITGKLFKTRDQMVEAFSGAFTQ